jgi:hypothetical protein
MLKIGRFFLFRQNFKKAVFSAKISHSMLTAPLMEQYQNLFIVHICIILLLIIFFLLNMPNLNVQSVAHHIPQLPVHIGCIFK